MNTRVYIYKASLYHTESVVVGAGGGSQNAFSSSSAVTNQRRHSDARIKLEEHPRGRHTRADGQLRGAWSPAWTRAQPAAAALAPRYEWMESPLPAHEQQQDDEDDTVPAGKYTPTLLCCGNEWTCRDLCDPEKWVCGDVVRCVRWVSRQFSVPAPKTHLLPSSGAELLALTADNWLEVCSGNEQAARIFQAYVAHAHAAAKGRPPPPQLPEHQTSSSQQQQTDGGNEITAPRISITICEVCGHREVGGRRAKGGGQRSL
ncbi:unnamed protein product [Danaus chrysippus]|uniref:(African queen) hypothetical protein n=1 Tax=Danaus chrysippus TaxID=151541 RepID=A0A8J2QZV6_9NEOP|nr:unnamed protein product [Danaus chrysippus]